MSFKGGVVGRRGGVYLYINTFHTNSIFIEIILIIFRDNSVNSVLFKND